MRVPLGKTVKYSVTKTNGASDKSTTFVTVKLENTRALGGKEATGAGDVGGFKGWDGGRGGKKTHSRYPMSGVPH